jgi:hypothetical protein
VSWASRSAGAIHVIPGSGIGRTRFLAMPVLRGSDMAEEKTRHPNRRGLPCASPLLPWTA